MAFLLHILNVKVLQAVPPKLSANLAAQYVFLQKKAT
jgi:hypothetical protein